jgi:putative hydroxymethylpyrimidine transport system substrate-binding protein
MSTNTAAEAGTGIGSAQPRRLRVILEYFHPWTNSAGFYVARERGWYAEAGLDVELATFDPGRGDSLAYLARAEADFAVFPANRLLVRREAGEPVLGIAAINHRAMETIASVAGRGVRRPRDLAGRRLAMNPTPRGLAMVRHLVAADGGDPDAVAIVDAGSRELSFAEIDEGSIADASFGSYWAWEMVRDSFPEQRRVVWPVDTIGAPRYHSYLLGTTEGLAEQDSEVVRAFLAATERGFEDAAADQEHAFGVVESVIPYFDRRTLRDSLRLIAPTWFDAEGRWGRQSEVLMSGYARWLAEHGVLRSADAWIGATTNALLPQEARR